MLWVVACAALGGVIGWLLAGVNHRDTTAGAITGIAYGGGIIAIPMLATAGLHSLSDGGQAIVGLIVLILIVGGLVQFLVGDLFDGRRR